MEHYGDIPRLYTALAEWGACLALLFTVNHADARSWKFWSRSAAFLAVQSLFLSVTGSLPVSLWLPAMAAAAVLMYFFLLLCGRLQPRCACYCCAKAFLLAEFAASLEWQLHTYLQAAGLSHPLVGASILPLTYGLCFLLSYLLEKPLFSTEYFSQLSLREVFSAIGIVLVVFGFSNLSFVIGESPFTSSIRADIFNIRTLVDLAGIAILHAYQSRICEFTAEKEISQMDAVLKSQYDQYRNYQDSVELIHMKYHDLKHQITGLRAETDEQRRKQWIDAMAEEIAAFENVSRTGNQVLDAILGAKIFHCRKQKIQITCVADGRLLGFMHVTDICSIFGNALDNAIESVVLIPEEEKRLIHIQIAEKKSFVFIKVENYCPQPIEQTEDSLIPTTKADQQNHGYGLKSIRRSVEKYQGTMQIRLKDQWFELQILLPIHPG